MRELRILFLGGAKRVSMGRKFIAAGERLGLNVTLYSYELCHEVAIAAVAKVIIGRKWSDPSILDDLRKRCLEYHIDLIIPFVDGAVEIAARYCEQYGAKSAPVSSSRLAAVMFDKVAADNIFREAQLPVPAREDFPLIAKPRHGSASKGIIVIHDQDMLDQLDNRDDYLIQQYIDPRREITVDCYVSLAGEIIATVPRYRIETQGGEASVTETFYDPAVIKLARETLAKTGLRGAVTIQLLEDMRNNRLMLMEINPRLGGGAVCACRAGADLPEFILRDHLLLPLSPCDDWKPNIRVCRYFDEIAFDMNHKTDE